MNYENTFSAEAIDTEYRRLGHKLGWRLLTCPARNLTSASTCLISVNPGGGKHEASLWSVENGSAYVVERWKEQRPGEEKLQRQVRRMFELMSVNPEDVLSGYLVPFRSPTWKALSEKPASLEFGLKLWKGILETARPKTVIAFGKDISGYLVDLLGAMAESKHFVDWGNQTIDVYRDSSGGKLIVLPHLSRFSLFNRMNRPMAEYVFQEVYRGI